MRAIFLCIVALTFSYTLSVTGWGTQSSSRNRRVPRSPGLEGTLATPHGPFKNINTWPLAFKKFVSSCPIIITVSVILN